MNEVNWPSKFDERYLYPEITNFTLFQDGFRTNFTKEYDQDGKMIKVCVDGGFTYSFLKELNEGQKITKFNLALILDEHLGRKSWEYIKIDNENEHLPPELKLKVAIK